MVALTRRLAPALVLAACGQGVGAAETESGSMSSAGTSGESGSTSSDGSTASATTTTAADEASSSPDATDGSDDGGASSTTGELPPCDPLEWCTEPSEDGACRHELTLPDGMQLYYWSNLALVPAPDAGGCHVEIDRAVVVQHGNSRNPWSYFASVHEAATIASVDAHTLVVAPWFPSDEDQPPPGFHVWDPGSSGWKSGDDSLTDPPLSSFAVYDHLVIDHLLDPAVFPALEQIVVTGHSAGGQFAQRYAVASDVEDATGTVGLRFVVLNPSSYLYLDAWRWDGVGAPPGVTFELPSGTACDDDYDDFKYGLANVPAGHYVTEHMGGIPETYLARDVTYLLGEADTEQDSDLDVTCPAQLQGEHRLERGLVFFDHLETRFPQHVHGLATVPGVGHSNSAMYTSPVGVEVLFGR